MSPRGLIFAGGDLTEGFFALRDLTEGFFALRFCRAYIWRDLLSDIYGIS